MERLHLLAHEIISQTEGKLQLTSVGSGPGEGYRCKVWRKIIYIQADGPLASAYAAMQLKMVESSGLLADWLGLITPRFPQRWLWLVGTQIVQISPGICVGVPTSMSKALSEEQMKFFAARLIRLGFNGIIFGELGSAADASTLDLSASDSDLFSNLIEALHGFGIKVGIKPRCNTSLSAIEPLLQRLPIDAILWESAAQRDACSKETTQADLHRNELGKLEKILSPFPCQLLYATRPTSPGQAAAQAAWLAELPEEAGSRTSIAFSTVAATYTADYLAPNPLWDHLQRRHDPSSTPLLPILNMGSVGSGDGLWPAPPFDLLARYLPRLYRHPFGGAIVLTKSLPLDGTPLDAALWVCGHSLFSPIHTPEVLINIWLQALHPQIDGELWRSACSDGREAIKETYRLLAALREYETSGKEMFTREELLCHGNKALCCLHSARQQYNKIAVQQKRAGVSCTTLEEYSGSFFSDIRRLLLLAMQSRNITIPGLLTSEEQQPAFWTAMNGGGAEEKTPLRSGAVITERSSPCLGSPTSVLRKIAAENGLI